MVGSLGLDRHRFEYQAHWIDDLGQVFNFSEFKQQTENNAYLLGLIVKMV